MLEKQQPLILVFYLNAEMMKNPDIIQPFADSVNTILEKKEANIIAFFLPAADGEPEKLECINPIQMEKTEMVKINKLVEDISNNFDIGNGADDGIDNPENEIDING
jgi:hypothetical protein